MQAITADLSKLTTRQSLSRYNLDSRLDNVINTGAGLESIYGQRFIKKLDNGNVDNGDVRAMHRTSIGRDIAGEANSGNLYIVSGSGVWKIHSDPLRPPKLCGRLVNELNSPITFAESQGQNITDKIYLYVCDQKSIYRFDIMAPEPSQTWEDIGNALPHVNGSETERVVPAFISFRGHRLLLTCKNATQFFFSVLDPDSVTIDDINDDKKQIFEELAFYSTETKADKTERVIGLDVIYAFGTKTVEVWRDNNDNHDPYTTSINGNYLEGLLFPNAVAILGNEVYYFDNFRRLSRMSGGRREVLSDRAMERIWDGKEFINAFVIYANGCHIACFQDIHGFTMGYNTKSGSISELSCLSKVRAAVDEYLCDVDGNICRFDDSTYTMAGGEVIQKFAQLEVVHDLNSFALNAVMIDYSIQTVPDAAALNNQVFLQISPDGLNWRSRRILNLDKNTKTVKSLGFGLCRKMQARLIFTNANPVVFNSVTFLVEGTAK
jgi:hypothetical protein